MSWDDAKAYAAWMARRTGKAYRLPTEAEWEYAARSESTGPRPWGFNADNACGHANVLDQTFVRVVPPGKGKEWNNDFVHQCDDGVAYTAQVGRYRANAFGLHDMMGNVWEWVEDCYNESYAGAPEDGTAWLAGDCGRRVNRGGGWDFDPRGVRSADRFGVTTDLRSLVLGIRLARTE